MFSDNSGRLWKIDITVGSVKLCRKELGIDLLEKEIFQTLAADMVKLVDVVWLLVDKSKFPDVTDVDFAGSIGGDTIEAVVDAFAEALFDFFPPGRRDMERAIYRRLRETQKDLLATATKAIQTAPIDSRTRDLLTS